MQTQWFDTRAAWLAAGVMFGVVVSMYWPHETAQATTVDRSSKVALVTCRTSVGASDAIFVLDFVTGRLVGAAYNTQLGSFNQTYVYNTDNAPRPAGWGTPTALAFPRFVRFNLTVNF